MHKQYRLNDVVSLVYTFRSIQITVDLFSTSQTTLALLYTLNPPFRSIIVASKDSPICSEGPSLFSIIAMRYMQLSQFVLCEMIVIYYRAKDILTFGSSLQQPSTLIVPIARVIVSTYVLLCPLVSHLRSVHLIQFLIHIVLILVNTLTHGTLSEYEG